MALEAVEAPQDLATVSGKAQERCDTSNTTTTNTTSGGDESPPRRVQMLSRERRDISRRSLSRHSSGGVGPGMLSRERNRLGRAQSMRIVRPLAPSIAEDSENAGGGLKRSDMAPTSSSPQRRSMGSRPSSSFRRGVSRAKSMADGPLVRKLARSDSSRAEPSRRNVGRTISQGSLAHMASGGLAHMASEAVRPYRGHDKVVNQSIQRSDRPTLRRSAEDRSYSDLSSFTLGQATEHSMSMKNPCADPIDDHHDGASAGNQR